MLCNVCLEASRDKLAAFYIKMDDKYQINPTWEGVQIPWIGGGGLNQPPPLEINEGVVSDPRLLYRSLT